MATITTNDVYFTAVCSRNSLLELRDEVTPLWEVMTKSFVMQFVFISLQAPYTLSGHRYCHCDSKHTTRKNR